MRIFNADGSEAMMCGNGSRCVGKYVYEYGLTAKKKITLDTRSGIKVLKLHVEGGKVTAVTVDMGSPLETEAVDFGDQFPFQSTRVSMGNPHLVTFVEDITQINLPEIGPQLENYHLFPDRTNVEFAQIVGKDNHSDESLGKRFRNHPGLRNRCLCHGCSRCSPWIGRKKM